MAKSLSELKKLRNKQDAGEKEEEKKHSSLSRLKKKVNTSGDSGETDSQIRRTLEEAGSLVQKASEEYTGMDVDRYRSQGQKTLTGSMRLSDDLDSIRMYMERYGDTVDPGYLSSVQTAIGQQKKNLRDVTEAYSQIGKAYGGFQSTEEYNKALEDARERKEMLSYDTEAGRKELADLDRQLFDLEGEWNRYVQRYRDNGSPASGRFRSYQEAESYYTGALDELKKQKEEKTSYIDRAEYLQKGAAFSGVADPNSQNYDPDFLKKSGYVSTESEGFLNDALRMGYGDLTYEYINGGSNGMREEINEHYNRTARIKGDSTYEKKGYDYMQEDEIALYNYYYAEQGKEKAEEYLRYLEPELEKRRTGKVVADEAQMAKKYPVFASLGSVATSLASGGEYLLDVTEYGLRKLAGQDVQLGTNEMAMRTNAVRGTVMDEVDWTVGSWDVFDFLYSTAMSGADSLASSFIPGGGAVLGLSAAAQGTNDALERGMSNGQAFWSGLFSGVFEGLFESISIGKLNALKTEKLKVIDPQIAKTIAKNIGKSMLTNASEEALTEIANITYDTMINGDFANYTWEELKSGAWKDALYQVLESGASGALMGLGFGGVGSAIGYRNSKIQGKQTDVKAPEAADASADSAEEKADGTLPQPEAGSNKTGGSFDSADAPLRMTEQPQSDSAFRSNERDSEDRFAMTGESGQAAVDGDTGSQEKAASIEEVAKQYGAQARAVEAVFDKGQDVAEFGKAFSMAHRVGQEGGNLDALMGSTAVNTVLKPSQIKLAYSIGADSLDIYHAGLVGADIGELQSQKSTLTREQKTALYKAAMVDAKTAYEQGKQTGFVNKGKASGIVDTEYARKIRRQSPRSYVETQRVAKEMGVAVEIANIPDNLNGSIKNGVIQVNAAAFLGKNRRTTLARILAHEVTHRLKETAQEAYLAYRNHAIGKMAEQGNGTLEDTIRRYQDSYKGFDSLTEEGAMDEIAADYTQFFVENAKAFKDFAKADMSWAQRMIQALRNVIRRIRGVNESSGVAKEYEQALKLWEKAYNEAKEAVKKAPESAVEAAKTENGTVNYSIAMSEDLLRRAISKNEETKNIPDGELAKSFQDMEAVKKILTDQEFQNVLNLPPDIPGKTFHADSAYGGTLENTLICPRSMGADALLDAVAEYLGRPLTISEQIYISQEMQNMTDAPECVYCYVATDRKAYRAFLGSYLNQRDAVIKKLSEAGQDFSRNGSVYKDFIGKRKDTKNMWDRFNLWVDAYRNGELIKKSDLASLRGMEEALADPNISEKTKEQIRDAAKYAQAASWAKKRVGYVAYNGDVLLFSNARVLRLNREYGLRMYSFSDFSPAYILENMQMIRDASVMGLKMLGYTKDINFVKIFAPSGMNINVSIFGGERNGKVYENNLIGAKWEDAKAMRQQYKNVGVTFVATSDSLVEWALNQDWIDVVIPYHLVRTGTEVAKAFGFQNFTSESADMKITDLWKKGDMKSIPPTVHDNDKAKYLAALEQNHLKPRFERFLSHPGYMKLVNECRQSASNTKPVRPIFDVEAAESALKDMARNGGYFTPIGGSMEETYNIAFELSEAIMRNTDIDSTIENGVKTHTDWGVPTNRSLADPKVSTPNTIVNKPEGKVKYSVAGTEDILAEQLDSAGRELSREQQDYFRSSRVRDEDGRLKVMYHGTSGGGFTVFDAYGMSRYGLFGIGSYFTDNRSVAEGYTNKGRGQNKQVYEVYLNIKNPMDMDAPAKPEEWTGQFPDAIFPESGTNEDFYRAMEEYFEDEMYTRWEAADEALESIQGMGYDGITHMGGGRFRKNDDTRHRVYISFEAEQVKNADNRKPTENPDIRYSVAGTEKILEEAMQRRLKEAAEKYGTIPPGENPVRKVSVPMQTSEGKRASFTIRTVLEAGITPDELVPKLTEEILNGTFSDDVHTNKETIKKGEDWMAKFTEVEKAVEAFTTDLRRGFIEDKESDKHDKKTKKVYDGYFINEEITMRGYILYNQLADAAAKAETNEDKAKYTTMAVQILTDITNVTRTSARMVQATRILKKMSPECKYISLERAVENLNNRIAQQYGNIKLENGRDRLEIDKELAVQWLMYLNAGDVSRAAEAEERLYKDLASQVRRTFADKWNAWRYLSMLGNAKTLARNLVGNIAMAPIKYTKDKIAAGIERAFIKDQQKRTKAFGFTHTKAGNAAREYAREDYARVSKQLHGTEKYTEFSNSRLMQAIQEYKSKFQMHGLKEYQAAVDWVMNGDILGDSAFMKMHYAESFTNAVMARGWTLEQIKSGEISQEKVDEVRAMAYQEAQKATFRDINAFSKAVIKIKFDESKRTGKIGNMILSGILPFRTTPANVLARAVEYSPVELIFNATVGTYDVVNGNISATEYIDRFASGLTGTGVWALGMFLAGMGLMKGISDDDDDERKGIQKYSISIGGKNYSLDWLSPVSIPLFMGVECYECVLEPLLRGADFDPGAAVTAVLQSFQPILEMSCLSSIKSLLDTLSYVGEADAVQIVYAFFVAPFLSYISQSIPTILSQTAAVTESQGEKTYVADIENQFSRNITYDLVKMAEKLPFADWRQIPRVDAWGRISEANGIFESYVSPAYVNDIKVTEADKEIDRLKIKCQELLDNLQIQYRAADTNGRMELRKEMNRVRDLMNISPKTASTKISNVRLTAEEYTQYSISKGENNYILVTGVMESGWYKSLSDEEKCKVIALAYDLADARGKYDAVGLEADDWRKHYMESSQEASVAGIKEIFDSRKQDAAVKTGNEALRQAIRNGESASAAFKALTEAGKAKGDIQKTAVDEIKSLFMDGTIDLTTAKDYCKKYGGLDSSEAVNKATFWKFQIENPESELSETTALVYYRTLREEGITLGDFETAWAQKKSLTGSGNVKEQMLTYIDGLALSKKQKDSLYYAFGWAESKIGEAPWN